MFYLSLLLFGNASTWLRYFGGQVEMDSRQVVLIEYVVVVGGWVVAIFVAHASTCPEIIRFYATCSDMLFHELEVHL